MEFSFDGIAPLERISDIIFDLYYLKVMDKMIEYLQLNLFKIEIGI